jgi:predicted MPP superfamily phosphohydrolase
VFAGHAHGGLIRLPFTDGLIGPSRDWFPEHTSGLYRRGRTDMVVSRGLGNVGPPRVWNRPHLPVVTLKRGKAP